VLTTAAIAVVVAVILGELISQIVDSYGPADARSAATWEAAVSPIIAESDSLGTLLRAALPAFATENRANLDGTLETLRDAASEERATAASLGIAPPSSRAGDLLRSTLQDRVTAVDRFSTAVSLATGPSHDVSGATGQFMLVGTVLRAGDGAYKELLDLLRPAKRALPGSAWLQQPSPFSPSGANRLANELAADPRLAELRRLSIVAITVTPSPVRVTGLPTTTTSTLPTTPSSTTTSSTIVVSGSSGGTTTTSTSVVTTTTVPPTTTTLQVPPPGSRSYLLPTATIGVTVVVRNTGDVAISGVEVEVTLVPSASGAGTASSPSASSDLGSLGVGSSVAVALQQLAISKHVSSYRLEVRVVGNAVAPVTGSVELAPSG